MPFFFVLSAYLVLNSACLKDVKKKKKTGQLTKHACSFKFPNLVLTEITITFLNLTSRADKLKAWFKYNLKRSVAIRN